MLPFVWLASAQLPSTIELREGLVIGRATTAGRLPVPQDAVIAKLVPGERVAPVAGEKWELPNGQTGAWRALKAKEDGTFEAPELEGGGYVYISIDSAEARTMLLEAAGDNLVYVNGVPRAGDPYGYGYLRLPVTLKKGRNDFLFSVGRGELRAKLLAPRPALALNPDDLTLPDSIPSDRGNLFGAIVVTNATNGDATGLRILCTSGGKRTITSVPRVPAMSLRKVRFDFPAGSTDIDLFLMRGNTPLNSAHFTARVRKPGETYKRTFVSNIDGSVQYYAVNPSSKPAPENALILSVHGASVEAINQADAYTSKPWCTLVAPTNRRPYGFDWEDWGRLDALEVLGIAKASFPHDPQRVVLTGHSMGGHGTWSIGSMYPDTFGAVAPSAGWISFWSYAGGWEPKDPTPSEKIVRGAMLPSDTLSRLPNLRAQSIYILHGDADDNVPVQQARIMKAALTAANIPFGYHEEPGANHWWGNQCVDYPALMDTLRAARISNFEKIDFVTPGPEVSSTCGWIAIEQQIRPRELSHVKGDASAIATENVRSLRLVRDMPSLKVDETSFGSLKAGTVLVRSENGTWTKGNVASSDRHAGFSGPLKEAFQRNFVLVYGTSGSPEENAWSRAKARFDAESFYYRGNGSPEVVSDVEFLQGRFHDRNVAVYGNLKTNQAWARLLGSCPLNPKLVGRSVGYAFVYPSGGRLVAGIGGSSAPTMRLTDRLALFSGGTAFPDWTILNLDAAKNGTKGIAEAGYFGPHWELGT